MAQTVKITPALGTLAFIGNTSLAASTSAIFTGNTAGSIALAFPAAQGIEITGFVTVIGNITATSFIKSGGTAAQFLKADGSVDSAVYALASRTLTINGESYDLTANRSWTISTSDGYISDVQLTGNELRFTGEGSAFTGSIDLSPIIPTEQDTLDSVTDRGSITTNTIDVGGVKSDYFLLDITAQPTEEAGMFLWNDRDDTANLRLSSGVDLRLGQDLVWYVKAGVDITRGQVVMAAGTDATSGHLIGLPMIADGSVEERYVLGIATKSVTAGEFTHAVAFGKVYKLDILAGFQNGAVLFCDPIIPGGLTDVQPTAPQLAIPIAFVINNQQNNGVLAIRVLPGYHLGELHDINLTNEATGQLLRYNVNRWENWTPNYATTTYVDTAISNLVDTAPGTLDTLNELAAALGDDPNFATTVATNIAGKVSKAGDTMTGDLQVNAKIGTRDETGGFYLRGVSDVTHKIYYSITENANVWEYNTPIKFRYYNNGEPITRFTLTEAGNLSISGTFSASGYNDSNWNAAYNDKVNSASFNTTNGILTLTQQDGGTVTVDLDGKYSEIGHTHTVSTGVSGLITVAGTSDLVFSIDSRDRRALVDLPNTFDRGLYLDFKNPQIFPELTAGGYKGQMLWRAYGDASDMSGGYPIQIVYDQAGDIHYRLGVSALAWADQFSTVASQQWVASQVYLTTESDPTVPSHVKSITTTNISNWNAAYNDKVNSASFNTANGVLTLTQQDGGTVTVDLDGRYLTSETDSQTLDWEAGSKNLTISNGNTVTLEGLATEEFVASQGYITGYTETDTLSSVTGRGATTSTNISVNNVKVGTDGTYGGYLTVGFGGTTNGYNRVFGHSATSDGLFLASATGRGIYFRPNGGEVDHVTITASGNVGIGTTSPASKLHTVGSGIVNIVQSSNAVSYTQYYNTSTGTNSTNDGFTVGLNGIDALIFSREAGNLILGTLGIESMRITSAGNVGIGTTSPTQKLDVIGRVYVSQSLSAGTTSTAGTGLTVGGSTVLLGFAEIQQGNPLYFYSAGNTYNSTITQNGQNLILNPNLNVGIGTTSPNYKLSVVTTGTLGFSLITYNSTVGGPQIDLYDSVRSQETVISSTDGTTVGTYLASYTNHPLLFGTYASSTPTAKMTILPSGNVGIGTTSPTAKLTVNGTTAGESLLEVYGTNGLLFAVSDDLSNSLFSANTIAGLPVIEAFADGSVVLGPFATPVTVTTAGQINTTNHGNSSQWLASYNDRIVSAAVSGGPTKTLTLTQQDGGTVTASWSDIDTDTNTFLTNATFNTANGVLTLTRNDAVTVTVDLDDRYLTSYENNYISTVSLNESTLSFAGEGAGFNGDIDLSTLPFQPIGSYLTAESDTLASVTGRGSTTTTGASFGGNVGIGTTSPAGKLHVYGGRIVLDNILGAQSAIQFNSAGTEVAVLYRPGNTTDVRMYNPTGGDLMTWAGTNVGIGTTSPQAKLDVLGSIHIRTGSSLFADTIAGYSAGVVSIAASTNFIVPTGNVGIGTTSPITKLQIDSVPDNQAAILANQVYARIALGPQNSSGDVSFGSSGNGAPTVGSQDYGFYAAHNAYRSSTGAWKHTRTSTIPAVRLLGSGGVSSGNQGFSFDYSANVGTADITWTNLMQILPTGNVGIGTTTFGTAKLVVNGNLGLSGTSGAVYGPYFPETGDHTGSLTMQAGFGSAAAGGAITLFGHLNTTKPGWVTIGISQSAGTGATEGRFTVNSSATAGGTDVFTVLRTGNVGIGTTSPSQKLDVVGKMKISDDIILAQTNGRIDYDNGATGALRFFSTSASAERMRITTAGNVGIGTTSPAEKLHAIGNVKIEQTSNVSAILTLNSNSGALGTGYQWNLVGVNSAASYAFQIREASTAYLHINNSAGGSGGNVGIGNTAPTTKLDVSGVITATGGNSTQWNTAFGWGNHADFGYLTTETDSQTLSWDPGAKNLSISNGNTVTLEGLATEEFVASQGYITGYTETDTLQSVTSRGSTTTTGASFGGNVGIGTTAPSEILHVKSPGNNGGVRYTVFLGQNSTGYQNSFVASVQDELTDLGAGIVGTNTGSNLSFSTHPNGGSLTERMRITKTGNVGIGTTSPGRQLELAGAADAYIQLTRNNTGVQATLGFNTGVTNDWLIRTDDVDSNLKFYSYGTSGYALILARSTGAATFSSTIASGGNINVGGQLTFTPNEARIISGSSTFAINNNANNLNLLLINNSTGNVGIGTSSPGYKLDVQGSAGNITINTNGLLSAGGQIISGTGEFASSSSGTDLNFRAGATHLMVLKTSGNVGIGTTSPNAKLDVVGNTRFGSGSFNVSTDQSFGSAGQYNFRDAVAIWNPNSTSAPNTTAVMSIGSMTNGVSLVTTGQINASGGNSSQWNTAYGWGNHGAQGYATQTYVNTAISNLVDAAPGTLDTLNELAAALGDDPNFATTVATNIAGKVAKTGDTMTGTLTINRNVAGLIFNRDAVSNYNGIYYSTATAPKWFIGMRENLGLNNHIHYSEELGRDVLTLDVTTGNATVFGTISASNFSGSSSGTNTGDQTTITGNAGSATVLQTARTLTIGSTGKTFNGSANVAWSLAEIGAQAAGSYAAASHSHDASEIVSGIFVPELIPDLSGTYSVVGHTHGIGSITDSTRWWNNFGDNHSTRTAFDATTPSYGFGWRFVQGATNGPGVNGAGQYYSLYVGLGNDYPATGAGSYGMQIAFPRSVTTPYLAIRYNENNGLGSWQKISAGYADSAGNATTATTLATARTLTIGSTGKTFNGGANVSWTLAEIGAQAAGSYAAASHTHDQYIDKDGSTTTGPAFSIVPADVGTGTIGLPGQYFSEVHTQALFTYGHYESGLSTPNIGSLQTGTVVIWKNGKLQPCTKFGDHMVMGVIANGSDSPIVMGAELVLVTGPVNEGDYLLTSDKNGHAIAMSRAEVISAGLIDTAFAKALESGDGDSHTVKAMINKL